MFSCSLLFQGSPPLSPPFYYIFYIVFYIGSPLFFQFSVTGAGAGVGAGFFFFCWWARLVAGLQVGRALGCSGCLGLGSAVSVPPPPSMFLGTQPPYATKALTGFISEISSPFPVFRMYFAITTDPGLHFFLSYI